ncbi:MAG: HemK family modification methylase [Pseudonocardiales bacterium]|nr:HemK family modification methylase [Pseudonocardiales bacterium]
MASTEYLAVVSALRAAGCVFAEDEAGLLVEQFHDSAALPDALRRRVAGEPLEHVLGWVAFRGLRVLLDPGVFVPRRRTEFLAGAAIGLLAGIARPCVVDLCCGSGAVAAAVLAEVPGVDLWAVDIDPVEVACAARNIGSRAVMGDLFEPLPPAVRGRLDVVVANVPYVPTSAVPMLPSEARDHEPLVALDGGADGLDIARRLAAQAAQWLRPGGSLLVETSGAQAAALAGLFENGGLAARVERCDDLGATIVIGARSLA